MSSLLLLTTLRTVRVVRMFVCMSSVTFLGSLHDHRSFFQLTFWFWSSEKEQSIPSSRSSTLHRQLSYLLPLHMACIQSNGINWFLEVLTDNFLHLLYKSVRSDDIRTPSLASILCLATTVISMSVPCSCLWTLTMNDRATPSNLKIIMHCF